ncbi:MAG: 2-hydroxyacyl-CoA dehydratase family protein [Deltaproteobacteria bacterium]|jgi:benzoyl-CoA reductase/2-hydroxyglutaryl-CoA dehydratase subunit BcrC/BadD/HgdB|nr:2-hydroxyacyl-CoA dehydratase family protein [Deltaproteobacteria bacterium]
MNNTQQDDREGRIKKKIFDRFEDETAQEIKNLKSRPDFSPELEYFVDLLAAGRDPATISERTGRPVVALMCLQAPLELFHVFGLQPFKIFGGAMVSQRLSAPQLPAIMCPMLRSALGELQLDLAGQKGQRFLAWVAPTTCDWVVKIQDMMEVCGIKEKPPFHRLELPHMKDRDESQERWLEEVYLLKNFLSQLTGQKKIKRQALANSMSLYQKSWHVFSKLIDLKRIGLVPELWFMVISNSFFFDDVEKWTTAVEKALLTFKTKNESPDIFLAGSPIFFPNLKMLHLLEEAGLNVSMDDLCSSERIFPGAVYFDDVSEHGLLKALAQRYHQGCLCPTFADNDRRINNIIAPAHKDLFKGVVFHVLKGCHPFDLESLTLESRLKDQGLKFIKLETDYTSEDSQTLLTRLEAYRSALTN